MPISLQLMIFISSLIGLGVGQTAKINIVSPPAIQALLAPQVFTCQVEVDFFNASSKLVKSQKFSLSPGQSAQASLSHTELGGLFGPAHPLFYAEANINTCNNDPSCDATQCNIQALGDEVDLVTNADLLIDNLARLRRILAVN